MGNSEILVNLVIRSVTVGIPTENFRYGFLGLVRICILSERSKCVTFVHLSFPEQHSEGVYEAAPIDMCIVSQTLINQYLYVQLIF